MIFVDCSSVHQSQDVQEIFISDETLRLILPTFYECIYANILAPKKFKPKM